jgi:hypothetical protein
MPSAGSDHFVTGIGLRMVLAMASEEFCLHHRESLGTKL